MLKKNIFNNFLIIVIFFLVGFFLISNSAKNLKPEDIKYIKIAGVDVKVDLALDDASQVKGLSGRNELGNNEGMLFVFAKPGNYLFWMKDMNFPIDIVWIGENLSVVYIKKDARPELYPETYGPASPSQGGPDQNIKYVLEVKNGFSDKNNLKIGDEVQFL
jgi:uncharacterized membrane protein (UPF0127 family)